MEDTSKSFISLTDSNFSSLAEKFDTIFQKEKAYLALTFLILNIEILSVKMPVLEKLIFLFMI